MGILVQFFLEFCYFFRKPGNSFSLNLNVFIQAAYRFLKKFVLFLLTL